MFQRSRLLIIIVVVMLVGMGIGASRLGKIVMGLAPEPRFARVELKDVAVKVSATGTIEAEQQVVVKSKVAGRIVDLRVDEGDVVKAGDLIAHVDPIEIRRQWNQVKADITAAQARAQQANLNKGLGDRTLLAQLDSARAALGGSQADSEKVKAGARPEEIARAEAALHQAKARLDDAELNLKRQRDWVARGIARKTAEADLRAAEANLARVKAGARPQEIASAQAAVDRATVNCEEAKRVSERKKKLRVEGFASDSDVELADTQFKASAQDVKSAQEQLGLVKAGSRIEDIRASEAQAERTRVVLEQTKENEKQSVESAQAQYDIARHGRDSAAQDLALLKAGSRPEEIRSSEAQVRRALAALKEAEARMDQSKVNSEETVAARAQVTRLIETLGNVSTQLEDCTVRAPIAGVVIHRALRKGELVTSGISSFTAGMELVTLADMSTLIVRVRVNEVDVARLFLGQQASVTVSAFQDETFTGTIRKIAPASQRDQTAASQPQGAQTAGSSEIVWFDVEVRLPNPDQRLKPGMTANLDVVTAHAAKIPALAREAIVNRDRKSLAHKVTAPEVIKELEWRDEQKRKDEEFDPAKSKKLVITEQLAKAKKIEIKVGLKDDQFAQVKSGLAIGDWVLIKMTDEERQTFNITGKRRRN